MLQMRPNCECCGRDLPPDSTEAMICSFECTWCAACAQAVLGGTCANCKGVLAPRPTRSAELQKKYPASTERIIRAGCTSAA